MTAYCKTVEKLKKENERLKRTLESGSQDIQYAEKLLRSKVSTFNKRMKSVSRNNKGMYAGYDCLQPGILYLEGESLKRNLDNVFAQIRNAYLSGMHAAASLYKKEQELNGLEADIRCFTESVRSKMDMC